MLRRLIFLWLGLLVLSNSWRLVHPPTPRAVGGQQLVSLDERDGNALTGRTIDVAVRRYGNGDDRHTPILLLHGTPVASAAMHGLAQSLATRLPVISPDLPGFGNSMQPLPDYSSLTHGLYAADLLRTLGVERAHVVAYSQGGAAALAMADAAPGQVASLALVSAIGVQELELFGSYSLNHTVYAGQHILMGALRWLLPHFGYLDDAILGPGYTRNLTDTDQRRLRAMLSGIEMPTLIVHGRDDGLVPYEAAEEHRRLVPHSTLVALDGGHELAYAAPVRIAAAILPFLADVERGVAADFGDASAARLLAASQPYTPTPRRELTGAALVVLLLAIVVATYVSEDLTLIAAGLLVAEGVISFPAALAASFIGLFTGDLGLFAAGRWLGKPALSRLVSAERLSVAIDWLKRRGPLVIIASRFLPGTRLPTYVGAGALHMPWGRFALYFAFATLIWTPLLVGIAAAYGDIANQWFRQYAGGGVWLVLLGGALLWFIIESGLPLLSWRGRRLFYSRWQRLTHFEFWPRSAFYPPIVLYCIWLAIRFRSVSVFTLANPGMPLGGLVGESKSEILGHLESSGRVAPFALIDPGPIAERLRQFDSFVADAAVDYPLALKPDSGERGRDVIIVTDRDAATRYLEAHDNPVIAQVFVRGTEYGVFYIRPPDAEKGFLFSLTHKGRTIVEGDGRATLAELILRDERAVCMARFFLHEHAERLGEVPARGEAVALNRIGTHSRGSLFTDAGAVATEALGTAIDALSKHFDGFYFGRYDIITANTDSLRRGEDFHVIELNGVSSEATHIYDPKLGVWNAWRVTARQWRYAFEIGAAMRARGHKPPGALALLAAVRRAQ